MNKYQVVAGFSLLTMFCNFELKIGTKIANAISSFAQFGPHKEQRPSLTAWKIEQRNGTNNGFVGTLPENILLHANGSISINNQKISNSSEPSVSTDLTTKNYVDNQNLIFLNSNNTLGIQSKRLYSTVSPSITIEAMGTVFLRDTSGTNILCSGAPCFRRMFVEGDYTFDANSVSASCPSCGALSNNTQYYVYVYNTTLYPVASVIAFEISTDTPASNLVHKTGDKSRLYLGNFLTDGAAGIIPFSASQGSYQYDTFQTNLNTSSSPLFSTPFTTSIPAHAKMAILQVAICNGTGYIGSIAQHLLSSPSAITCGFRQMEISKTQQFYQTVGVSTVTVQTIGFRE